MTSRFQHPHIRFELILPIEDAQNAKTQVIQINDLQEVLEILTRKSNNKKGKQNAQ